VFCCQSAAECAAAAIFACAVPVAACEELEEHLLLLQCQVALHDLQQQQQQQQQQV
jgi:hypothetical protein